MKQYTLYTPPNQTDHFDNVDLYLAHAVIKCSDEYNTTVVLKLCTGQMVTIYVTPDSRHEPSVYVNLYKPAKE